MPSGGKRPGSGRPRGSRNKKTQALAKITLAATEAGELPLEFMLRLMRDPTVDGAIRMDMAKSAAPFCHARLAATQIVTDADSALVPVITFRTVYVDADGNSLIGCGTAPADMKTIEHQ